VAVEERPSFGSGGGGLGGGGWGCNGEVPALVEVAIKSSVFFKIDRLVTLPRKGLQLVGRVVLGAGERRVSFFGGAGQTDRGVDMAVQDGVSEFVVHVKIKYF
jgi:hypothetical protein